MVGLLVSQETVPALAPGHFQLGGPAIAVRLRRFFLSGRLTNRLTRPVPPLRIMMVAGETSGDLFASEIALALRRQPGASDVHLFGAGGTNMQRAGVQVSVDLTRHSVIGLGEVLRKYMTFRRLFRELADLAIAEKPDVFVGVDFGGFNLRLAHHLHDRLRASGDPGGHPRLVQCISPQVWASRPGRARVLERCHDLLISILPFEKAWYAAHAPKLRVEYVGHPIVDRRQKPAIDAINTPASAAQGERRGVLLLPGSRVGEIHRHVPVLIEASRILGSRHAVPATFVLPDERLAEETRRLLRAAGVEIPVQVGGLQAALETARVALASTGTVTLECACAGVPTVAFYRTSWGTYQVARRLVTVKYLAMPNLLADQVVMPEFVQSEATGEHLAEVAGRWLSDPSAWKESRAQLLRTAATLGSPGVGAKAAAAILGLVS